MFSHAHIWKMNNGEYFLIDVYIGAYIGNIFIWVIICGHLVIWYINVYRCFFNVQLYNVGYVWGTGIYLSD